MIRFQPDTLRDALWRPISMAAPDAGVYMEIMVPDFRYVVLLLLTIATVPLAVRGRNLPKPVGVLLGFVWLTFVPWLATTGNGRYFMPVLLVTGPLCIGLLYHLPMTMPARLALAGTVLAVQGTAVMLSDARGAWGLASWFDTYFEAELTPADRKEPGTYVLATSLSYSLVAPLFAPESRWVSIASLSGELDSSPDIRRAQAVLTSSQRDGLPLRLLVPTQPGYVTPDRQPNARLRAEINRLINPHRLALATGDCRVVPSRTMASTAYRDLRKAKPDTLQKMGFWICPLDFPVNPAPVSAAANLNRFDAVFEKLERSCPRFFHPGEAKTVRMSDGFSRTYPSSDTKSYVLDDGQVYFKYWRALNANALGPAKEVMAEQFRIDCSEMRGRAGLPWERLL